MWQLRSSSVHAALGMSVCGAFLRSSRMQCALLSLKKDQPERPQGLLLSLRCACLSLCLPAWDALLWYPQSSRAELAVKVEELKSRDRRQVNRELPAGNTHLQAQVGLLSSFARRQDSHRGVPQKFLLCRGKEQAHARRLILTLT